MRATEILMREHEVILKVLDCLERLAERPEFDLAGARDALEFLTVFADTCHHGKEEQRLFPAMIAKGLPERAGPIAVMLHEHEEGRAAVAAMRGAVSALEAGENAAAATFERVARGYVRLLRDHIAKENEILFPMADQILGTEEQAELVRAFDSIEHGFEPGTHDGLVAKARALSARLGVDWGAAPTAGQLACRHG